MQQSPSEQNMPEQRQQSSQPLPPNMEYPPQQGQYQQPYGQPPSNWQPQRPPKKFHKGLWITLGIIAAVVVFGYVGVNAVVNQASKGVSAAVNNVPATVDTSITQMPTSIPTIAPTIGPSKVGQTIISNGVSSTLVSVKTIPDDGAGFLKSGNEWIVVTVKIANNSGQDYDYTEFDFSIVSGTGNATDAEFAPSVYTANNEMESMGTLTNGGSTKGDIIFQAPKGDHKTELSWKPSSQDNTTDNVWLLGL